MNNLSTKVKSVLENAIRHIENAKQILREKGKKERRFYTDDKYVSMAGHTAYRGVLLALNKWMKQEGISKRTRKNVDDYRDFIARQDRKMLNYFNQIYEIFHLVMGYDGIGEYKSVSGAFECAEELIEWINKRLK